MKINPRYYPTIIVVTFILFTLLGLLLGFRPQRGGEAGHGSSLLLMQSALLVLESIV